MKLQSITTLDGRTVTVGEAIDAYVVIGDAEAIEGRFDVVGIETVTMGLSAGNVEIQVDSPDTGERWIQTWDVL